MNCCWSRNCKSTNRKDKFLEPWGQYIVTNALINVNRTKQSITFAKLQLLLDEHSSIEKVAHENRIHFSYQLVKIQEIPKIVGDDDGKFLDIVAIPVEDLGGRHPRYY